MVYQFNVKSETALGDLITPVQLYMKLRDRFPNALLLESSDYHSKTDAHSFICLNPIANFVVDKGIVTESYPDKTKKTYALEGQELADKFNDYKDLFQTNGEKIANCDGFFGYIAWDAIPHFESVKFHSKGNPASVPEFQFALYQNLIVFNHFHNEIVFLEYENPWNESRFLDVKNVLLDRNFAVYPFQSVGEINSNLKDQEFKDIVKKGKNSCFRGDVFQIVPSRQFQQKFEGDDFNVYRVLRAINPSPYLFYFDYGNYKILGSSPESQMVIANQTAQINPIAGTVRRSGYSEIDRKQTDILINDPKENAEHVMLVDLARNDLSRNSTDVKVENYKEIQYFSHVIHMVSKVTAKLSKEINTVKVFADAFPAGTLSGAPKFKAMQLIDSFENQNRGVYGGALGFIGFDGTINTAITIRTFVSKENTLYFQAGAGVVSQSVEESELQEVNHKLGALRKAIEKANELFKNQSLNA